jgi:hypothetical protein
MSLLLIYWISRFGRRAFAKGEGSTALRLTAPETHFYILSNLVGVYELHQITGVADMFSIDGSDDIASFQSGFLSGAVLPTADHSPIIAGRALPLDVTVVFLTHDYVP